MSQVETKTLGKIFASRAALQPNEIALRFKRKGQWQQKSWAQYYSEANITARALMALGLEPRKGVCIIGSNRPEWFLGYMGAILAGGFPTGIYATSSSSQCIYIAAHSDSCVAFVENPAQLENFKLGSNALPAVKAYVLMEGAHAHPDVYTWGEFFDLGRRVSKVALGTRVAAQGEHDLCALIYTSGTTGHPKGVMLSHHNIIWTVDTLLGTLLDVYEERFGGRDFDLELLSYLPLSHIAEQLISLHSPLFHGGRTSFVTRVDEVGDALKTIEPTVFLGVPRVWEKIRAKIEVELGKQSWIKKTIVSWVRRVALKTQGGSLKGRRQPWLYRIIHYWIISKLHARLGLARCLAPYTSAAPISRQTLDFFMSFGIPIYEIYGMSECTGPAAISDPNRFELGKAGYSLPGTELRVDTKGEICVRGPHVFMGYYKDERASRAAIDDDQWLHTGDIGEIDAKGFLSVTGRFKDILITSGGENIPPRLLEEGLCSIELVGQAVVVGDGKKYLTALVCLDPKKRQLWLERTKSRATTLAEAAQCQYLQGFVQKEIDSFNRQVARVQTIKNFCMLSEELSLEGGLLTPTMKIMRAKVYERYSNEIEAMYTSSGHPDEETRP
jgi:long-subunit acyl-CoA synthetase (AMP-forming)